ncbi:MAG: trimeric autotransporter adhesin, partial [Abditibacteriota bacterium]|nr:trimeric autotransporter adhesin [Abditibacteriota bacterium]
ATGNSATGNSVRGNSIANNGTLGINLQMAGEALGRPTLNDRSDDDSGANTGQNFPLITGIAARDDKTIISGKLESTTNTAFVIDLHFNTRADASGYGEGETWAGSARVTTGSTGTASWSIALAGSFIGETFSATATDVRTQNSSEFGPVKTISPDTPPTVAFSYPQQNANVSDVSGIRGIARDSIAGSGISLVVFYIRRQSDGLYWNSAAWGYRPYGLATLLQNGTPSSANWARPPLLPGIGGVLPSGANLKPGAYTLQVVAYNGLGNKATAAITINVVPGGA